MGKMKKKLKSLVCNLDVGTSAAMLVALMLLTFCGVFRRYIFRSPIIWMEEVQMILFVWVVFLAAGAAFRSGGHIAIEIVVDALPKKIRAFVEGLDVVLELVILGYVCYQAFAYYFQLTGTGKVSILLRIPYSVAFAVLPLGCVLMIISFVISEVVKWREKKNPEVAVIEQ